MPWTSAAVQPDTSVAEKAKADTDAQRIAVAKATADAEAKRQAEAEQQKLAALKAEEEREDAKRAAEAKATADAEAKRRAEEAAQQRLATLKAEQERTDANRIADAKATADAEAKRQAEAEQQRLAALKAEEDCNWPRPGNCGATSSSFVGSNRRLGDQERSRITIRGHPPTGRTGPRRAGAAEGERKISMTDGTLTREDLQEELQAALLPVLQAIAIVQQDVTALRLEATAHTRVLNILPQDVRLLHGAINDMAKETVTAGEIEAVHHDLNRMQLEVARLAARVEPR
jgi:flagellar biosynthesis GTPase FlhF